MIRKFTRNRKIYPNEESALKLVFMAIREASKKWTMPIHHWKQALNHFAILYEDRMPELTNIVTFVLADTKRFTGPPAWEKQVDRLFQLEPTSSDSESRIDLLTGTLEPMIQRELVHRRLLAENRGYDARLVGWVEIS